MFTFNRYVVNVVPWMQILMFPFMLLKRVPVLCTGLAEAVWCQETWRFILDHSHSLYMLLLGLHAVHRELYSVCSHFDHRLCPLNDATFLRWAFAWCYSVLKTLVFKKRAHQSSCHRHRALVLTIWHLLYKKLSETLWNILHTSMDIWRTGASIKW